MDKKERGEPPFPTSEIFQVHQFICDERLSRRKYAVVFIVVITDSHFSTQRTAEDFAKGAE
jgi:hypothetical protein